MNPVSSRQRRSAKHRVVVAVIAASLGVATSCGSLNTKANTAGASSSTTASSAAASPSPSTTARGTAPSTTARSTTPTALPNPCVLVAKADAVKLAATPLDDGVKAGSSGDLSCTYVGPPTGPLAQVEFFVGDGAKKFLDVDRELGHDITNLPGVGDEAYLEDFTLFFRVGRRWNALRLTRLDDFPPYQQPMIDLAKKVASTTA